MEVRYIHLLINLFQKMQTLTLFQKLVPPSQSTLCEQPENGVDNEFMADKNNMSRWAMVYLAKSKSMHQT